MVWVALVYAIAGTWLIHLIGRPLVPLNFGQQKLEADFRFSLVRFRENAEAIALYRGEADELKGLRRRFGAVFDNWWAIMQRTKKLMWFRSGYNQLANIFPILVAAPRFFSGAIQLGGLIQTASAFGQVQDSLSWFVNAYTQLAEWKATVDRLTSFHDAMSRARAAAHEGGLAAHASGGAAYSLRDASIDLPDGTPLITPPATDIAPGAPVLVTGPSGAGKSTLFRALAGIWPFGRGRVLQPAGARALFLPQKTYLTLGTLREQIAYPSDAAEFSDAEMREALAGVGLPHFSDRLDETRHWAFALSGGEQQRIAFARALVNRPQWLFLDEATSALDEASERKLYALLARRLPDTTMVSIGHRTSLQALHPRRLEVRREPGATGTLEWSTV
jgi:putative ATP-binding cassette transporter